MATNNAPDSSALKIWDDAIWSPNFGDAHLASTQEELLQSLIERFREEAGRLPVRLRHSDGRWFAHFFRDREGAPAPHLPPQRRDTVMVYWRGPPSPIDECGGAGG